MTSRATPELIRILWGNGVCYDGAIIRHLLHGGYAHDFRSGELIAAMSIRDLPPGSYRLVPHERWPF